jgi:hypothetical protein
LFSFSSLPAFPYGEYTAFAEDNNALALQKMKVCSMPKVAFKDDDLTVDAEQGASLRDLAQAEDASIPFGCEQGLFVFRDNKMFATE